MIKIKGTEKPKDEPSKSCNNQQSYFDLSEHKTAADKDQYR